MTILAWFAGWLILSTTYVAGSDVQLDNDMDYTQHAKLEHDWGTQGISAGQWDLLGLGYNLEHGFAARYSGEHRPLADGGSPGPRFHTDRAVLQVTSTSSRRLQTPSSPRLTAPTKGCRGAIGSST